MTLKRKMISVGVILEKATLKRFKSTTESSFWNRPTPFQFTPMAMAVVAAAGPHHSNSLQSHASSFRFSNLAAHLPYPKTHEICTSFSQFRAFAGFFGGILCFRKISRSPRRTSRDTSKSWRTKCTAMKAESTDGKDIMEGDVVEYPLPEEVRQAGLYGDRIRFGLGAVSELVLDPSSSCLFCHLEPLVMDVKKNEPPKATWVVDERQDMVVVPLTQVRRLEAWLSMRMVDDRISNPHGEHAEHLWLVEEPLSESSGSPMFNET